MRKLIQLLTGAAIIAPAGLLLAEPAFAQSTNAEANSSTSAGLGDIVVTARRREERIQDVPVAISVVTTQTLAQKQISNSYDLAQNTPGLSSMSGAANRNAATFFVRGMGYTNTSTPSVVTYFADVPLKDNTNTGGTNNTFYDLESIQVLKGPQGTLFGRTTTAGAVLLSPKKPSGEFDGFVEVAAGNLAMREVTGAVNIPIIGDKLAIRVAGNYRYRDGFTHSIDTGQPRDDVNRGSYRVSLLAKPTDWLENTTIFQDVNINENGGSTVAWRVFPTGSVLDTTPGTGIGWLTVNYVSYPGDPAAQAAAIAKLDSLRNDLISDVNRIASGPDSEKRRYHTLFDQFIRFHSQSVINTTVFKLPDLGFLNDVSIKNIFGMTRNLHASFLAECCTTVVQGIYGMDYINGKFVDTNRAKTKWGDQWSDEIQFAGKIGGRHDIIIGYFNEQDSNDVSGRAGVLSYAFNGALSSGLPVFSDSPKSDYLFRQSGLFGQTTIDLGAFGLEGAHFTAGIRRSQVKQRVTTIDTRVDPVLGGFVPTGNPGQTASLKQSATSYSLTADYKVTPNVLVYLAHRHGFKAGGINLTQVAFSDPTLPSFQPLAIPFYKPEKVDDYEFGIKADWTAGSIRGRTNIAVFQANFSDLQRATTYFNTFTVTASSQVGNVAKERSRGFEFETSVKWNDLLETSLSYAYLDAKYTDYPGTITRIPDGVVVANILQPVSASPKHKINLLTTFNLPVPEHVGQVSLTANVSYQSEMTISDNSISDPIPETQPAYALVDLRADWQNVMGSPVDIGFFVKNVANKVYAIGSAHVINARLGVVGIQYAEPRTFGVRVRARFGASAQ
jgi:iron complex outermembrane receptor protein